MANPNNTIELDAITSLSADDIIEVCDVVGTALDGGATYYKPTKATVGDFATYVADNKIVNTATGSGTLNTASYHTSSYLKITVGGVDYKLMYLK